MCYGAFLNTYIVICVIIFYFVPLSSGKQNVHYFGRRVETTYGEVWPKPMHQKNYDKYLKLEPDHFQFNVRSKIF